MDCEIRDIKETIVKVLPALLISSLALTSGKGPAGTVVAIPPEADLTPTPTPAPFWDYLPLTSQPEGGWKIFQNAV